MYTGPARPAVNTITKYFQVRPDQRWIILQSISKSGQTCGDQYYKVFPSPARPAVNTITKYFQVWPDQRWILLQSISKSGQTSDEKILQSISKSGQTCGVMSTSPARPAVNTITKYFQVRPDQRCDVNKSSQTCGEYYYKVFPSPARPAVNTITKYFQVRPDLRCDVNRSGQTCGEYYYKVFPSPARPAVNTITKYFQVRPDQRWIILQIGLNETGHFRITGSREWKISISRESREKSRKIKKVTAASKG